MPQQASERAPSPFVLLLTHAASRGGAIALAHPDGESQPEMSWSTLFADVEDLAAGLVASGIRTDQIALVAMSPGHLAIVVELALRAAGAVPVRLTPGLGDAEAAAAFASAPVSLVVVDDNLKLEGLAGLPLGSAQLFDTSDADNVTALLEAGRAHLRDEPELVARADQRQSTAATQPRVIVPTGEALAPSTEARPGPPMTERDRVLLVGEPHDPFTSQVRSSALATGATLAWARDATDLAHSLVTLRPTLLALDAASTGALASLIDDARVGDHRWHPLPSDVLDAVAIVAAAGTIPRGSRRLAADIGALKPWFGGELTQLLTAVPCSPRLRATCEALEIEVVLERGDVLAPADLPTPPVRQQQVAAPPVLESTHLTSPSPEPSPAAGALLNVEVALKEAMCIDGAVIAMLVDHTSGMALSQAGETEAVDLDIAAAGTTDVVRAKLRTMESLGNDDTIEDMLITLGNSYHLIRLTERHEGLFLYLVLEKDRANLAMARHKLASIEKSLEI